MVAWLDESRSCGVFLFGISCCGGYVDVNQTRRTGSDSRVTVATGTWAGDESCRMAARGEFLREGGVRAVGA